LSNNSISPTANLAYYIGLSSYPTDTYA